MLFVLHVHLPQTQDVLSFFAARLIVWAFVLATGCCKPIRIHLGIVLSIFQGLCVDMYQPILPPPFYRP